MPSLGVVRGPYLNPWDAGNYMGVIEQGVELYLCGQGPNVDWDQIMHVCPGAKFVDYKQPWEVLDLELDILDLPDAHYPFSQYLAQRHPRTVIVAWDNLPGKNTVRPEALKALENAWKCVARSELAQETLIFDGIKRDKIQIIYGAVDTDTFKPLGEDREDAVLFVGRITPEKGILDLIWAMADVDAKLYIAGSGDIGQYDGWLGRCKQVEYLGQVGRDALVYLYNRVKVLCVPSVPLVSNDPDAAWLEQFGQVFVEAMACGTPIISTYSGAIPEVVGQRIVDDYTKNIVGNLVNPRDWKTLRRAIEFTLWSESEWTNMSKAARARSLDMFSQEVIGKQIVEWYELG